MKQITVITPDDAEYGFRLSGVSQHIVERKGLLGLLLKTIRNPDTGLVIIDERLLDPDIEEKIRDMEKHWNGVLLVLPSPERPEPGTEDYAARLMRRAIGYHVQLRL